MFVVSTIRGFNLVFQDLDDLAAHVNNLQAYLEYAKAHGDTERPIYGLYPSDYSPELAKLMTESLKHIFTEEGLTNEG